MCIVRYCYRKSSVCPYVCLVRNAEVPVASPSRYLLKSRMNYDGDVSHRLQQLRRTRMKQASSLARSLSDVASLSHATSYDCYTAVQRSHTSLRCARSEDGILPWTVVCLSRQPLWCTVLASKDVQPVLGTAYARLHHYHNCLSQK